MCWYTDRASMKHEQDMGIFKMYALVCSLRFTCNLFSLFFYFGRGGDLVVFFLGVLLWM